MNRRSYRDIFMRFLKLIPNGKRPKDYLTRLASKEAIKKHMNTSCSFGDSSLNRRFLIASLDTKLTSRYFKT